QALQLAQLGHFPAMAQHDAYAEAAVYRVEMCKVSLYIGDYRDRVAYLRLERGEVQPAHALTHPEEAEDSHPIFPHASFFFIIRTVEESLVKFPEIFIGGRFPLLHFCEQIGIINQIIKTQLLFFLSFIQRCFFLCFRSRLQIASPDTTLLSEIISQPQ